MDSNQLSYYVAMNKYKEGKEKANLYVHNLRQGFKEENFT